MAVACGTTTSTGAPTPVGTFDACSGDVLKGAESILGEVTADLVTSNYTALLTTLGASVGLPEVKCAVALVVAQFSAKASQDAEVAVVMTHAHLWQVANP